MSLRGQPARQLGALFLTTTLLGIGIACSASPAGPSPTSDPNPPSGPSPATAITISPAQLSASVNDPVRPDGRYLINPSVTFNAAGTAAATVKEVRFSFVVDADRVIKQGAFLVHGGDLRRGPVTQQYPLTFDVPVHFPNLRVQMQAVFVDDVGAQTTQTAEASIQIPGAQR